MELLFYSKICREKLRKQLANGISSIHYFKPTDFTSFLAVKFR